jgi:hypothetical protein
MTKRTQANESGNTGGINGKGKSGNNNKFPIDGDGNEITPGAKFFAGFLLILFTIFSAIYLIGHWPDRLAPRDWKPLYIYEWFHVRLAEVRDSGSVRNLTDSIAIAEHFGYMTGGNRKSDTMQIPSTLKDSSKIDSLRKLNNEIKARRSNKQQPPQLNKKYAESELLHINTLLLILVAVAGFLGNMIYIASSFATYIGNGEFKRRWTVWYIIKPFTAAALAIAIYFVFRGGFLNMSDDTTNINLYGLITISFLTGLFTDRTTLKLKEVFDVLMRPKEERANPLTGDKPQIINIDAQPLEVGKTATIIITGKNLDKKPLTIKIEGQEITSINKQSSVISFNYILRSELKDKDSLQLEITDDSGQPIHHPYNLTIKKGNDEKEDGANGGMEEHADRDNQQSAPVDENQQEFGDPDSEDLTNSPKD